MELKTVLKEYESEINQELQQYFNAPIQNCSIIYDSMKYSLFAGGKRLRPILMLMTYELYNDGNKQIIYPFACALEMIHTYSLIHDDLPAMDNDDFRRGIPTNHKVFREGFSILAGDALLNLAFEAMIVAALRVEPTKSLKAMYEIATASGVKGMIGGQVADLIAEQHPATIQDLQYIHKNKTAALITASIVSGAILGHASEFDISVFRQIGENIGLAFQIQDDILDVIGDETLLGKPLLSDEKNNKSTYVKLVGIENAQNEVKKLSDQAIDLLKSLGRKSELLEKLILQLIHRKH